MQKYLDFVRVVCYYNSNRIREIVLSVRGYVNMNINEVPSGSIIEVTIKAGNRRMAFSSVAVSAMEDPKKVLVVEPMFNGEKLVIFKGQDFSFEVVAIVGEEAKPYLWKQVAIATMKSGGGKVYHAILSDQPGKKVNRRSSFRLFIGAEGMLQIGNNSEEINVFVKDVSATGFSFVCDPSVELRRGSSVTVAFRDEGDEVRFKLNAGIVRKEEIKDGESIVYGCRLKMESEYIQRYVVDRQRRQSSHTGGESSASESAEDTGEEANANVDTAQETEQDQGQTVIELSEDGAE